MSLRASVGSTEASASPLARVGVVGPKHLRAIMVLSTRRIASALIRFGQTEELAQSSQVYAGHSLFRRNPRATKSGPERPRLHPEQGRRAILVGAHGSIDLEAPQVVVQLALLAGLGVLQRLDLPAQVVELGFLLVELPDVPGVEVGVLSELAHVLADARLLLADLGDGLFQAGALGLGLPELVAELDQMLEGFLDGVADRLGPDVDGDLVAAEVGQRDGLVVLPLLAHQEPRLLVGVDGDGETVPLAGALGGLGRLDEGPVVAERVLDEHVLLLAVAVADDVDAGLGVLAAFTGRG